MAAAAVNETTFESEVMQSDVPVLVDFWAPWCGPCKAMSPVVDELAEEYAGRLKVVKINVDDAPRAAARFGVSSIPNFTVIYGGEVKAQLVGVRPKKALLSAVEPYLTPDHAACRSGCGCERR